MGTNQQILFQTHGFRAEDPHIHQAAYPSGVANL
jgi:hypothetical protein